MKPLVSVITVCFNAAGTIQATLDSVRSQTWRPIESVVVDGASSDGTQEIVASYGDIVGAVISERDEGIYDAMNKGVGLARGEIIHFLNADDCFIDDSVVEGVARVFMSEPHVDLVYGDAVYLTQTAPSFVASTVLMPVTFFIATCVTKSCFHTSGCSIASAYSMRGTGSMLITTGCFGFSEETRGCVICNVPSSITI